MLKIAEMEYSGGNSIFLRVLLDKKYALPYRVENNRVHHSVGKGVFLVEKNPQENGVSPAIFHFCYFKHGCTRVKNWDGVLGQNRSNNNGFSRCAGARFAQGEEETFEKCPRFEESFSECLE